jgi:hypothetical protein
MEPHTTRFGRASERERDKEIKRKREIMREIKREGQRERETKRKIDKEKEKVEDKEKENLITLRQDINTPPTSPFRLLISTTHLKIRFREPFNMTDNNTEAGLRDQLQKVTDELQKVTDERDLYEKKLKTLLCCPTPRS